MKTRKRVGASIERYVAEQHVFPTKKVYNYGQQQQPNTLLKKPPLLADPPPWREQSKSPSGTASQSTSHQSLDRRKSNMGAGETTESCQIQPLQIDYDHGYSKQNDR